MPSNPSFTFQPQQPIRRPFFEGMTRGLLASISFLVLVFVLRFGASLASTIFASRVETLEEEIAVLSTKWPRELGESITGIPARMSKTQALLDSHLYGQNLFDFLRANVMKTVSIDSIKADVSLDTVELDGRTVSYEALAAQLALLKSLPLVSGLTLLSVVLGEGGRVNFHITLKTSPQFFRSN
ncbi:MAG: PilN domain-containing protein [Candidatus Portnoybacteria bacterium]|nr:PilN domain-containing protein [Candidatus Portnoybacteria bacterium]